MSGHRNFNELLAKMSPERRARVKAEADDLHREYVLSQIRQQVGFTQADVAERPRRRNSTSIAKHQSVHTGDKCNWANEHPDYCHKGQHDDTVWI